MNKAIAVGAGLRDGFAVLQRFPIGDLVGPAANEVGGLQKDGRSVRPGQSRPAPVVEGAAGGIPVLMPLDGEGGEHDSGRFRRP